LEIAEVNTRFRKKMGFMNLASTVFVWALEIYSGIASKAPLLVGITGITSLRKRFESFSSAAAIF